MTTAKSRIARHGIVVCVLLLAASAASNARELRMQGANGEGGGCTHALATVDADKAEPATARQRNEATRKIRPAPLHGDADSGAPRMPRWHSFLPGMFR